MDARNASSLATDGSRALPSFAGSQRPSVATALFAALLGVALASHRCRADDGRDASRIHWGLQGGIRTAELTFHNDEFPEFGDPGFRVSWSAGVQAVVPIAGLELETGLRYVQYREFRTFRFTFLSDGTSESFTVDERSRWHDLAIPVVARIRPLPAKRWFVGGGAEAAYLMRATLEIPDPFVSARHPWIPARVHWAAIFEDLDIDENVTSAYHRWDLSGCGVLGFDFAVAGHVTEIEARYTYGLGDRHESENVERRARGFELLASRGW